MKHFLLNLFTVFGFVGLLSAQYTTPDTGMTYSLDDLVAESPATISVSGSTYSLTSDLTISATDTFLIATDATLEIGADVRITIFGTFNVSADNAVFTAIDPAAPYDGFRFEEFSEINIQNATIEYGGGLRVLTETFTINSCLITNNVSGVSSGGTIGLSRGTPQITNNMITFNETPAINSGANLSVSPYIYNNYIEGNNQANSNRPQINMGPSLPDTPIQIVENTIKGDRNLDRAGGISVSNLFGSGVVNAIIDNNTIVDNRYGLTIAGSNSFAYIRNNVIDNNNTETVPFNGGSGISLNSTTATMEVIASGNAIRGNLWGITVIGQASINLGDNISNVGQNVFSNNGNGGAIYALFNNTPNPIMAMHNCWDSENVPNTLADAEAVISHENDDASLGLVTFDPVDCAFLSVDDLDIKDIAIYPNPSHGQLNVDNNKSFNRLNIYSVDGKLITEKTLRIGANGLDLNLNPGIYLLELKGENARVIKKLVIR
ncbi:T9SS type A sorting domain-containing protein [Winogradskyella bathintestinalis]|uniref:T9SS type A sorting domain-containing protein n=1 Tax=Winogradskyella bathintestinalis TaxID=3035208 RepID=A0ABT7ZTR4_9FLAO|nr:T9SS type A sorting domain-containing protein [Winogradskyella bathintestinalis]MDN3492390.1 T9SS type A sorting domain-containing protein [Winogradskyella bathintestinalis]